MKFDEPYYVETWCTVLGINKPTLFSRKKGRAIFAAPALGRSLDWSLATDEEQQAFLQAERAHEAHWTKRLKVAAERLNSNHHRFTRSYGEARSDARARGCLFNME